MSYTSQLTNNYHKLAFLPKIPTNPNFFNLGIFNPLNKNKRKKKFDFKRTPYKYFGEITLARNHSILTLHALKFKRRRRSKGKEEIFQALSLSSKSLTFYSGKETFFL